MSREDRGMNKQESKKAIPHRKGFYEKYIKRPQDFLCALAAIIVLSPVMLITAILVKIKLGSPVIFTQDRPGLHGKIFKLYKFRSMTDERDEQGNLLPDEVRLTSFGKKLRSSSLDELPELFNMLKGDMSVVGPRPLLVRYLERYNEHQVRRHEVRPDLPDMHRYMEGTLFPGRISLITMWNMWIILLFWEIGKSSFRR